MIIPSGNDIAYKLDVPTNVPAGNYASDPLWWNGLFAYTFADGFNTNASNAVCYQLFPDLTTRIKSISPPEPDNGFQWNAPFPDGAGGEHDAMGPFVEVDNTISYGYIFNPSNSSGELSTLKLVRAGSVTFNSTFGDLNTDYDGGPRAQFNPNYYSVSSGGFTENLCVTDDGDIVAEPQSSTGVYAVNIGNGRAIMFSYVGFPSPTLSVISKPLINGDSIEFDDGESADYYLSYFGKFATFQATDGTLRAVDFTANIAHKITSNKLNLYAVDETKAYGTNGGSDPLWTTSLAPSSIPRAVYPYHLLVPLPLGCIPLCEDNP